MKGEEKQLMNNVYSMKYCGKNENIGIVRK